LVHQGLHCLDHLRGERTVVAEDRAVDVEGHEGLRPTAEGEEGTGGERARQRGSSFCTPPRYGRSAAGTWTEPSACWWFSSRATIHRVVANVPLTVATGVVPDSPRVRTASRRAWKVVQ